MHAQTTNNNGSLKIIIIIIMAVFYIFHFHLNVIKAISMYVFGYEWLPKNLGGKYKRKEIERKSYTF